MFALPSAISSPTLLMTVATTAPPFERALRLQVARGQEEHVVAVHHESGRVGQDAAVAVAVEGQAEVRPDLLHALGHRSPDASLRTPR
jgi:hypothetical protein